jgi:voltage-gated potassium channel
MTRTRGVRYASEGEREQWLHDLDERITPVMAWLGIVFALILVFEIAATDLAPGTRLGLEITTWVIWALFATEFAIRIYVAPHRRRFLRRRWIEVIALLVPVLRIIALLRLASLGRALPAARVLSTGYRATGTAQRLLRSRLGYLAGVGSIVILAVGSMAYLFEEGTVDPAVSSFPNALMWAFAVVVALQGDPVPSSLGAHLAMLAGFTFGLVVIASLAGSLGAFLVESGGEKRLAARGIKAPPPASRPDGPDTEEAAEPGVA